MSIRFAAARDSGPDCPCLDAAAHRRERAGARALEDAERVRHHLPHLGTSGVRFSKDIERLSGGRFEVKFFEPGALIPPLECFDAVSKGSIEVVLDHARLSHRQVSGARVLHHGAVRARLR